MKIDSISHNGNRKPRAGSYAALLLDLDGTLIATEQVSPRVREAVNKVSQMMPVSIATGREARDTLFFARELGLTAPQISDGGSVVIDPQTAQPLWTSPLPVGHAETIINHLHQQEIAFIATHASGSIRHISQFTHWDIIRISAMDMLEAIADQLTRHFLTRKELDVIKVYLHYNGLWAVDFTQTGINKGSAALRLARQIGIAPAQMIGAGDSYNDLPLLQACGLKIAMGSAPPELKSIADYVAPSVEEDGLAVAIEEFVLPLLLEEGKLTH